MSYYLNKTKIIGFSLLCATSLLANSYYQGLIKDVLPLNIILNKTNCEQIKQILPVFKNNIQTKGEEKYIVYGELEQFLLSCNIETNKIEKINLYNQKFLNHLKLNDIHTFESLKIEIAKHFKSNLINEQKGEKYSMLEIFVSNDIYQVIVFNNNSKSIEFVSLYNPILYPEYTFLSKLKDKTKIPPLFSWLFEH